MLHSGPNMNDKNCLGRKINVLYMYLQSIAVVFKLNNVFVFKVHIHLTCCCVTYKKLEQFYNNTMFYAENVFKMIIKTWFMNLKVRKFPGMENNIIPAADSLEYSYKC